MSKQNHRSARPAEPSAVTWKLRLYVVGQTPRSLAALGNLKRLCEERLKGRYEIEVVDLEKTPHLAQDDQIVAVPTLIRKLPPPVRKIIGDLSDPSKTVIGLELKPV
jgi:circadian clock protein KaiB